MAAFIQLTGWQGEFTPEYFAQPAPDPALFGLPAHDDGTRDDPLLSGTANGVTGYRASAEAIAAASTRVVLGVGVETGNALTARATRAAGVALHLPVAGFPSHHGGFGAAEGPYPGQPEPFAATLRQILDG